MDCMVIQLSDSVRFELKSARPRSQVSFTSTEVGLQSHHAGNYL
jgi:hypothetical protein